MGFRYIVKKIAEAVGVIFVIVTLNFFLIRFMPGDPVMHIIGEEDYFYLMTAAPEVIEQVRVSYDLDESFPQQYLTYLNKTAHLDFGNSFRTKTPVLETVLYRMRWTLVLALTGTIIAGFLGGLTGLWAGWKNRGWFALPTGPLFTVLLTIPSYCLAIILLLTFGFHAGLFPIAGITSGGLTGFSKFVDVLWHMALPLTVIVIYKTAANHMLMKSTVTLVKDEAYITTAVAKGLPERRVITRHLLKNSLGPYITYLCMQFGAIFAGAMMVEVVFSWRGMGTLIYEAVNAKDFPILQTCLLFIAICIVAFNLIADILCMLTDPRIKEGLVDA